MLHIWSGTFSNIIKHLFFSAITFCQGLGVGLLGECNTVGNAMIGILVVDQYLYICYIKSLQWQTFTFLILGKWQKINSLQRPIYCRFKIQ